MSVTEQQVLEIEGHLPEIALIRDPGLRRAVAEIWYETWQESLWEMLEAVPKNSALPIERTLVTHSRSVALLAVACAQVISDLHGIGYDQDILVAAALLHDVSKMYENDPAPDGSAAKAKSLLIQHGAYGAHKAWEKNLPVELVHNILAHTHASALRPATWEAVLVHYVDYLDSDGLLFTHGRPLLVAKQ